MYINKAVVNIFITHDVLIVYQKHDQKKLVPMSTVAKSSIDNVLSPDKDTV